MKPAVFLDRDGTIIENVHHLADPGLVKLIPRAAQGIQLLRQAGLPCIVVSNQSAVGRGLLTLETLELVHQEMCKQLSELGAMVDGWYFCPEAPKTTDRTQVDHPDRKPGPGMLLRSARELNLDVSKSWMIGDMVSDLLAGRNAGCRGSILVKTGFGHEQEAVGDLALHVANDLYCAAEWLLDSKSI